MLQAAAGHLNEEHCVYHASHGARRTVSWYDPWRCIFIFFSAIVTLILVHSLTRFTFYYQRNDQQSKKCDVYPGGRDDPPWPPPPLRYRAEQRLLGGLTPAVPLRATGLLGPDPGAAPVLHRARLAPGADAEEGQQAAVAHWIRRVSYEHFVYISLLSAEERVFIGCTFSKRYMEIVLRWDSPSWNHRHMFSVTAASAALHCSSPGHGESGPLLVPRMPLQPTSPKSTAAVYVWLCCLVIILHGRYV